MPRVKNRQNSLLEDVPVVRTGGRVKKAKVVFDPSENNMPRRRSSRALSVGATVCLNELTGDSPPKIKKIKSPSTVTVGKTLIDNQKKYEKSEQQKHPPILEPHISDCCMICGKQESKKGRKLIPCKDCNYKVHPICLKICFQNQNLLEEHWRCKNCTTCVVCYETSVAGILITCCVCVDAYHLNCHTPTINKALNKLNWECSNCQNINKSVVIEKIPMNVGQEDVENTSSQLKVNKQDVFDIHSFYERKNNGNTENLLTDEDDKNKTKDQAKHKDRIKEKLFEDEIPDVSGWSCERVCKYIEKKFPREADVFRQNEIDGASLLLMKRSDVVRGLSLKLGPALHLYNLILRLQSKSDDPSLPWM